MEPLREVLSFLQEQYSEKWLALFKHCLTTTYFQWGDELYEQTSIGSPLSLVIVNLCMKEFGKQALNTANHTPTVLTNVLATSLWCDPTGEN